QYPYVATSVTEFWRRWHISLSSWLRDYVYIPIGGNRTGSIRTYVNLMLVFALCGFWHGARWNFLIWGLWHGGFLVIERLARNSIRLPTALVPLKHAYTIFVAMLGWVLFRADSLPQALGYFATLFGAGLAQVAFADLWNGELALAFAVAVPCCLPIVPWIDQLTKHDESGWHAAGIEWAGPAAC